MENWVSLTFKDTNTPIAFDLNKNTLFFGNNGRGKTRVLKTIESLYKLLHQADPKEAFNLIDKMYLKELKIGKFDCVDLFKNSESIKIENLKQLSGFIKRHKSEFRNINKELIRFRNAIMHSSSNKYSIFVAAKFSEIFEGRALYLLRKICEIGNTNKIFKDLSEFEDFFMELDNLINEIELVIYKGDFNDLSINRNKNLHENNFDIDYLQFNMHHLKSKYKIEVALNSNNIKRELENISLMREKIISDLTSKTSYYITTDSVDINRVLDNINSTILSINNDIQNWLWSKDKNLLEKTLTKQNDFLDKINIFNKIMQKYGQIEIKIENITSLKFYKENRIVPFEKLSSGERKIAFLFLEILFNDVDVYLIDEPELSISLNFQNKIVIDLHNLTKAKNLFIATHAPFIYEDFKMISDNVVKEVN